jgi:hypothetical protein
MSARMNTGNFANLLKPGLRDAVFSTITDFPKEFRQWANVINGANPGGESGRAYFDDLQVASFGTAAPKPEGEHIQYDDIREVATVRYTPITVALGARATMEMYADEKYGVMQKLAKEITAAVLHQFEVRAHLPLNSGFATTAQTGFTAAGFDTGALFSTAHTLKRGGTQPNRVAADSDLSSTALQTALDYFELTVSESNTPAPRKAKTLVVPPQLRWIAKELTQSELKPYTTNNEINPIKGEFQFIVSHYLTDADSWFLLSDKEQHDINVWIRMAPAFEMGDDFDTGDAKMKVTGRIASGHGDYRGTFGSLGA